MELYTTVGYHVIDDNSSYYAVNTGNRILNLTNDEVVVWQFIYGHIKSKGEIGIEFNTGNNGSNNYMSALERLQYRNLVVCGSGSTEVDAIYNLLGNLVIIPVERQLWLRLLLLLNFIIHPVSLKTIAVVMRNYRLTPKERYIYRWLKKYRLTCSEAIQFIGVLDDKGAEDNNAECLLSVLETVVGLYSKKWIYFDYC